MTFIRNCISRSIYQCTLHTGTLAISLLLLIILSVSVFSRDNEKITDQPDALIAHALFTLDNGEYESARELFNNAAYHGMTIDSLNYFLAKTYMYEGIVEDALRYNAIIDAPGGSLMRRIQLEQRYAIYLVAQDSIAAQEVYDSLVSSYSTTNKHSLFTGISLVTNTGLIFQGNGKRTISYLNRTNPILQTTSVPMRLVIFH